MRGKTTIVCHLAHRREKAQIKDLRGNQIETHQDQRDHHTDFGPGKPVFRFRKQANRKQIDDGRE